MEVEKLDVLYVMKRSEGLFIINDGINVPIVSGKEYGTPVTKFIFTQTGNGYEVSSEYHGRLLYRKPLTKNTYYVVTALYVDIVNSEDTLYKEVYSYMVDSGHRFRISKTKDSKPFEMFIDMKIDIVFEYTIDITINNDLINAEHVEEIIGLVDKCNEKSIGKLYKSLKTIDEISVRLCSDTIDQINDVY